GSHTRPRSAIVGRTTMKRTYGLVSIAALGAALAGWAAIALAQSPGAPQIPQPAPVPVPIVPAVPGTVPVPAPIVPAPMPVTQAQPVQDFTPNRFTTGLQPQAAPAAQAQPAEPNPVPASVSAQVADAPHS